MDLISELQSKGFTLSPIVETDVDDFIEIERTTHYKHVAEHSDFSGPWNEQLLRDSFKAKMQQTFFRKLLRDGKPADFLGYDKKADKFDSVFMRIVEIAQNNGIGTLFLSYLKEQSRETGLPVFMVAINTNPAQKLYKRLGFELYQEDEVFCFFRYIHNA